jgi:serine/threonine protein kinase
MEAYHAREVTDEIMMYLWDWQGPFTKREFYRYAEALCFTLDFLHQQNVAHR